MKICITGCGGLIGYEAAEYFCKSGHEVIGIDNGMREQFFGYTNVYYRINALKQKYKNFIDYPYDVRIYNDMYKVFEKHRPDCVIHCAAQPSHDWSAKNPIVDFDINARGTMNVLEVTRLHSNTGIFIHMSTNKVYGDIPNKARLIELETRYAYANEDWVDGINESMSIDNSTHSIFGASKVAADVMVQEYGNYFGLYTCCLRGGCLTGPNHDGAELHGFLNYLIRQNAKRQEYKIFGYKGKQVRDNIHAYDVVAFMNEFIQNPKKGEVYNIGGGFNNSISILEAISKIESISNKKMITSYVEQNRIGDHICYISDLTKIKEHYPDWSIKKSLDDIFIEIYESVKGN